MGGSSGALLSHPQEPAGEGKDTPRAWHLHGELGKLGSVGTSLVCHGAQGQIWGRAFCARERKRDHRSKRTSRSSLNPESESLAY